MAGAQGADDVTGVGQAIPEWLKVPFLAEQKVYLSLGLVMWGFVTQANPYRACCLVFNTCC